MYTRLYTVLILFCEHFRRIVGLLFFVLSTFFFCPKEWCLCYIFHVQIYTVTDLHMLLYMLFLKFFLSIFSFDTSWYHSRINRGISMPLTGVWYKHSWDIKLSRSRQTLSTQTLLPLPPLGKSSVWYSRYTVSRHHSPLSCLWACELNLFTQFPVCVFFKACIKSHGGKAYVDTAF